MNLVIAKVSFPKFVLSFCVTIFLAVPSVCASENLEMPGRILTVDSVEYHIFCTGTGDSTIIFESGLGGNYLDWSLVQPLLSNESVTVCSYDRAGYGWSSMGKKPRLVSTAADELAALIKIMEIPRPITFVGHSYGGLIGVALANREENPIDGMIFLDSMHPDQYARFKNEAGVDVPTNPSRAIIFSSPEVIGYGLAPEQARLAYQMSRKDKVRSTMYNELRNVRQSMDSVNSMNWSLIPSLVLVHGRRDWDGHASDGLMEDVWLDMQEDTANRSGAELVVLEGGHQLQLDNPEDCAEQIRIFHNQLL